MQLIELDVENFNRVNSLSKATGALRYLDPTGHIGFDIFDEVYDQPVSNSAPWDQEYRSE